MRCRLRKIFFTKQGRVQSAGQNLGAGRDDRVKQGIRIISTSVIILGVVMGLAMYFFGYQLSGAFTTCGVNYTELGTKSADIAFDILMGGEIGEFVVMDGGIITVNTDTAAALGLDYSAFSSMANTVKEVATAE